MEHYYYPGIILPMKEKWLDLLLSGKKTVEVRRTSPKIEVERLYLYLRGQIHGYVEVKSYKAGKNPTDARLRQLANEDARAHAFADWGTATLEDAWYVPTRQKLKEGY